MPSLEAKVWIRAVTTPGFGAPAGNGRWNPGMGAQHPERGIGGINISRAIRNDAGFLPCMAGVSDGAVACNFGGGYDPCWIPHLPGKNFIGEVPDGFLPGWPGPDGTPTKLDFSTKQGSATEYLPGPNTVSFNTTVGAVATTGPGVLYGNYYFEIAVVGVDIFTQGIGGGVGVLPEGVWDATHWIGGGVNAGNPYGGVIARSGGIGNGRTSVYTFERLTIPESNCLNLSLYAALGFAVSIRFPTTPLATFHPVPVPCVPCCPSVCERGSVQAPY